MRYKYVSISNLMFATSSYTLNVTIWSKKWVHMDPCTKTPMEAYPFLLTEKKCAAPSKTNWERITKEIIFEYGKWWEYGEV